MTLRAPARWRPLFLLAGILIVAGGLPHPRGGTLEEMLADPAWIPSHTLVLAGFLALLAGLVVYRRTPELPDGMRRWVRLAIAGTGLQTLEMVVHTAAVVDRANLAAGDPTPVLTVHLALAVALYPVFAAAMVGLIVAGGRHGALGSPWIAWLGITGAVAHGLSAPLVVGFGVGGAGFLFPLLLLLALWMAIAALWPVRAPARVHPDARVVPASPAPEVRFG